AATILATAVLAVTISVTAGTARAEGIFSEVRLGVLAHDVGFLGGREPGADINAEVLFVSPFPDDWGSTWPQWLRWIARPRPHIGGDVNTAGATSQAYLGLTWTAVLARDLLRPEDDLEFDFLFGPSV